MCKKHKDLSEFQSVLARPVLPVCSAQYLSKMVQETVVNQQQGHGQPWFNDEREKRTLARVV